MAHCVFFSEIGSTNKAMVPWLFAQKGKYNKMCCPLEPIRPSPTQVSLHTSPTQLARMSWDVYNCPFVKARVRNPSEAEEQVHLKSCFSLSSQTGYRNKCEFLISVGADGEDKTIGFRLGKYKGGSCAVVGPAESCHVSAEAKKVVSEFQTFIRYWNFKRRTENSLASNLCHTFPSLRSTWQMYRPQDNTVLCVQARDVWRALEAADRTDHEDQTNHGYSLLQPAGDETFSTLCQSLFSYF